MIIPFYRGTVQISAVYSVSDFNAIVMFEGHNDPSIQISIVYDGVRGLSHYDITSSCAAIAAQDCECFTILARCESSVVACAILEIDISLFNEIGTLLRPCATQNMSVDQCEGALVDRALTRALDAAVPIVAAEVAR